MSSTELDQPASARPIEITPDKSFLHLPIRDLWEYRHLIYQMVRRDIISQHKQTALGPFWYFVQPILASVVYTIIFKRIANLPTDDIPPFLFYLAGTTIWSFLAASITRTSGTFTGTAGVFSTIYFPRLSVPLAQTAVALFPFIVQLLIFAGFYLYFLLAGYPIQFSYRIIIIPFLILQLGLLGIGVGTLVAAATVRFRDLQFAVGAGLQFWMYASCIFYPRSKVPDSLQWLMTINPAVPIVEAFRFSVVGRGEVEIYQWLISLGITAVVFIAGLICFGRAETTSMDTV